MHQRGSILIGVLWCMVLLAILVIGILHTARMDLIVVKNYGDRVQAHYLALAGVERAKAVIYKDIVSRQGSGKNHDGNVYNDTKNFKSLRLGRGEVRVFHRAPQDEGGQLVYGVTDEESRLNINVATANEFTNLAGMTPGIVGAIMTWRNPAVQSATANAAAGDSPSGANSEYYMSLRPPYMARNGPFQTVRELLMVRGVTRPLLLGNDENQNEFLDDDDDPADPPSGATPAPRPDPGWEPLLTVAGTEKDVNASGKARVNPQTADAATLTTVAGITPDIANAIIAYRGQNAFKTLDDLLSVTPPGNNQVNNGNGQNNSGNRGGNGGNGGVISQDLFERVADDFTMAGGDLAGMINVNTAPLTVLTCLPGIDQRLAQAIINYRKSSGYFDSVAGLLKVSGMTRDIFKQLLPMITVRSETYRITAEGKVNSSGVRQRVQEIVHIGRKDIETLAYREDL